MNDFSLRVLDVKYLKVYENAAAACVRLGCPRMTSALVSAIRNNRRFLGLKFIFLKEIT